MDDIMNKEEEIEKPSKLPPIKTGDEVGEGEPHVSVGDRKANIPQPVPFREE